MHGLHQEVRQVARTTLTFPFKLEDLEDELSTVPGTYLQELWQYHQRVRTHLMSDLAALKEAATMLTGSQACSRITNGPPHWLDSFIESIAKSLELFDFARLHASWTAHVKEGVAYKCQCEAMSHKTRHAIWIALTNVVHSCMTKVSIDSLQNRMIPVIVGMFL
jgi:hypothetical protein